MGKKISRALMIHLKNLKKMLTVIKSSMTTTTLKKCELYLDPMKIWQLVSIDNFNCTLNVYYVDGKVMFVLCCLPYQLPDCRLKPDHTLEIHFVPVSSYYFHNYNATYVFKENTSMPTAEEQVQILSPCIVVWSVPIHLYLTWQRHMLVEL